MAPDDGAVIDDHAERPVDWFGEGPNSLVLTVGLPERQADRKSCPAPRLVFDLDGPREFFDAFPDNTHSNTASGVEPECLGGRQAARKYEIYRTGVGHRVRVYGAYGATCDGLFLQFGR